MFSFIVKLFWIVCGWLMWLDGNKSQANNCGAFLVVLFVMFMIIVGAAAAGGWLDTPQHADIPCFTAQCY